MRLPILSLALCSALAWALPAAAERSEPGPQPSGTRPLPGLANPASKNCIDLGGRLDIVSSAKGEIGICTFADGSQCEEWDLFRGRCQPPTDAGTGTPAPAGDDQTGNDQAGEDKPGDGKMGEDKAAD